MIVSVFWCKLVDIVPMLLLIITSRHETDILEYSCVKHMFG